jgi:hypothetical protein
MENQAREQKREELWAWVQTRHLWTKEQKEKYYY